MNRNKSNLYDYVLLRPFKYLEPSVHSVTIAKFAVLLPYLLLLILTKTWDSIAIISAAVFASVICESLDIFYSRKTAFKWIYTLNRAIIIGLLLPQEFSPVAVFLVTLCTILTTRYVLGGFSDSWVSDVALAVAVCYLIGENVFPQFMITPQMMQTKNPSLSLIQSGAFPILTIDQNLTSSLNDSIFSFFRVTVPEGYISLLLDSHSSIPAFRFNLLTMAISIILISFNFLKSLVPAVFLLVYSLLIRFVGPIFGAGLSNSGDILLALFTSGTLFSSVFLLQGEGILPLTKKFKCIYGIIAGIFAFLIMGPGTSSIGFVFTVLLINIISPILQYFETKSVQKNIDADIAKRIQEVKEGKNA